jgi:CheY-like chemotaxis protein
MGWIMRIPLIEDDYKFAESLRTIFDRRKFAVDVVPRGELGIEALTLEKFDLAISDIGLPRRDGFNVAKEARAAGVLILTARDAGLDRVPRARRRRQLPDQSRSPRKSSTRASARCCSTTLLNRIDATFTPSPVVYADQLRLTSAAAEHPKKLRKCQRRD